MVEQAVAKKWMHDKESDNTEDKNCEQMTIYRGSQYERIWSWLESVLIEETVDVLVCYSTEQK